MIFISSGKGGWIFGSLFLAVLVMMGVDQYLLAPGKRMWPVTAALAFSGLFSIALGLHGRLQPVRLVLERDTGRELMRRPSHSAYWIPAEIWGVAFVALAAWVQTVKPAA